MSPEWLKIAIKERDVEEFPGVPSNPRIEDYLRSTTYNVTTDDQPWCAAFVGWCLEQAGVPSTKSARARSYLDWGISIAKPIHGCVVVLARGPDKEKGHVGFFWSEDLDQVYVLGGNQSNKVCVRGYYKYNVLGYRVPEDDYWKGNNANPSCYSSNIKSGSNS